LLQTSYQIGVTNYAIIRYHYQEIYPPNKAIFDIVPTKQPDDLVLGFVTVDSNGDITQILSSYNNETRSSYMWDNIVNALSTGGITEIYNNINMNHFKILNLLPPVSNNDIVNKEYADSIELDGTLQYDSTDTPDYLDIKLQQGQNISIVKTDKLTVNISDLDLLLKKKVTSADSGESYIKEEEK